MRNLLLILVAMFSLQFAFSQTLEDQEKLKDIGLSDFQMLELQKYANEKGAYKSAPSVKQISVTPKKEDQGYQGIDTLTKKKQINESVKHLELNPSEENKEEEISIYGSQLFVNENIQNFESTSILRASDDYILSTGDELNISIWGYSNYNNTYIIDENGAITPMRVGRIYLKGLKFGEAKKLLKRKFQDFFDLKNSEFEVLLNYSRDITVNIVGEVNKPGSYQVKGYHTAFNALYTAKGISGLGSYRDIKIKRNGKIIANLDIYKFLVAPSEVKDIYLEDGDYIIVGTYTNRVKVEGAVKKPMTYELIDGECINDLIQYSGGLKYYAYTKNVQLERYEGNIKKVYDINLQEDSFKTFRLKDGDELFIRTLPDQYENFVEVIGAVNIPGKYSMEDSMTIWDLINKAEGLSHDAFIDRVYLVRTDENLVKHYKSLDLKDIVANKNSEANLTLENMDKVTVFSKNDFLEKDSVKIVGAVRKPGNYVFGEEMNLKDILYISGGLKREAAISRIEVSRIIDYSDDLGVYRPIRTIVKVIEVDYNIQVNEKDALFKLKPMDQLFVRTEPIYEKHQNVSLIGELNYPGTYTLLTDNDRLSDLLKRAGGVSDWAFLAGAKLYRSEKDLGYMFLDLEDVLDNEKSVYNYILKAGDTLFIPKINDLVSITGAVEYPMIDSIGRINSPYIKGKRAKYYVKQFAVDFDRENGALRRKTTVILPNGMVKKTKNYLLFKRYPKVEKGSIVNVGIKDKKIKEEKVKPEPVDWNTLFESFTVKVTAILTLYFLVNRL